MTSGAPDNSDETLEALLRIAGEDDAEVGSAAGEAIAVVLIRRGRQAVYDVPWWSFTTSADEAFDAAIGRHQRAHPEAWDLTHEVAGSSSKPGF